MPSRSLRLRSPGAVASVALAITSKAVRIDGRYFWPSAVSAMARADRRKSFMPSAVSSAFTCWLTAPA